MSIYIFTILTQVECLETEENHKLYRASVERVRVRINTYLAAGRSSGSILSRSRTNRNGTTNHKWDYIIYINRIAHCNLTEVVWKSSVMIVSKAALATDGPLWHCLSPITQSVLCVFWKFDDRFQPKQTQIQTKIERKMFHNAPGSDGDTSAEIIQPLAIAITFIC